MKLRYLLILFFVLACRRELDISQFSLDFSDYNSELRIEALILPHDSTAIVRIDKSYMIDDTQLYDCRDNDYGNIEKDSCLAIGGIWHGKDSEQVADCGDWNPLIHDIGIDGIIADPTDDDKDCEGFGDTDCREEDSIGENNGVPDCGEPNVDNYKEFLPNVHNSLCDVSIKKMLVNGEIDSCNFIFSDDAGQFFSNKYIGDTRDSPTLENIEIVKYGAYIPDSECRDDFWIDYSAEYSFIADCKESGFDKVTSAVPIKLPQTIVYVGSDPTEDNIINILNCSEMTDELDKLKCLKENSLIYNESNYDTLYFPKGKPDAVIYWASIFPYILFQNVQYFYDSKENIYRLYHGHPGIAIYSDPEELSFDDIVFGAEEIVTELYDGEGDGIWTPSEEYKDLNNNKKYDEGEDFTDLNENGKWDAAEIYADENSDSIWNSGNQIWDFGEIRVEDESECKSIYENYILDEEGGFCDLSEYFIDKGDGKPDVENYYYEIFTFSNEYNSYFFYEQLSINDPERTNLRDESDNPVMGAFGSINSDKIYFRIIDCEIFDENTCSNDIVSKSVCKWVETVNSCSGIELTNICIPIDYSVEKYCE